MGFLKSSGGRWSDFLFLAHALTEGGSSPSGEARASGGRRPYCLTTMPRLRQPGRAGRRGRNGSLRRWPGQSGPARIPGPVSGSSCRRCTPVLGVASSTSRYRASREVTCPRPCKPTSASRHGERARRRVLGRRLLDRDGVLGAWHAESRMELCRALRSPP
jgi:hypothetical protein